MAIPKTKDVYAEWSSLYTYCVTLKTIKERDEKLYKQVRTRLANLINDIDNALKNISLPDADCNNALPTRG